MAHELATQIDGRIAMAYREGDAAPWHALETSPQVVPAGAPLEIWADAAGLNYEVACRPNHRADGTPIADSFYIERTDTGHVTGPYIAGQWQPVQNSAILSLADRIRDRYHYDIVTAGALFGGASAWVQLEAGLRAEIGPGDEITSRPLFTVRHTGREANTFAAVQTRVVCNNTLTAALGEADADIFRHDHRVPLNVEAVETVLGLNAQAFGAFAEQARRMAARALSDVESLEYFRAVMGGRETVEDDGRVRHSQGVRKALAYYSGRDFVPVGKDADAELAAYVSDRIDAIARGARADLPADAVVAADVNPGHALPSAANTLWGAFNTVTWLADQRPVKNRGTGHAIASHLFGDGTGGALKAKAAREAERLLAA
jgi:phage/plasmid-like protein (TIGR03299 family)